MTASAVKTLQFFVAMARKMKKMDLSSWEITNAENMSDDSREENVYMAKLAEQAERYDEVRALM